MFILAAIRKRANKGIKIYTAVIKNISMLRFLHLRFIKKQVDAPKKFLKQEIVEKKKVPWISK